MHKTNLFHPMVHTGASTMGSIMEPKESQVRESRCLNGPQCEANKYWQIVFLYCLVNVTLVNGEYYDSNFHPLGPEAFALPCKLLMHGFLHSFGDNLNCMGDVNPMSPQLSCSSVKCLLTTCLSVPSGFIIGWSFSCQLKVVWHLTT